MMIVRTENSTYEIDLKAATWSRINKSERSGVTRTEYGSFNRIVLPDPNFHYQDTPDGWRDPRCRIHLHCNPLPESVPGTFDRVISTSPVVSIEFTEAK